MEPNRFRTWQAALTLVGALITLLSCQTTSPPREGEEGPTFTPYTSVIRNRKNVILMINDGASWGTWHAASYWEYGKLGEQPYDRFPVKLGMTTYPLNFSGSPTFSDAMEGSYDPAQAWDVTPIPGQLAFRGYAYLTHNAVDSAAAGTAMATGVKTYNNSINTDNFGRPLTFITEIARRLGKRTGVVTTVEFSHATPAAFGSVSASRNDYQDIARFMLRSGVLHLIMGGGHPLFDSNGRPRPAPQYGRIAEEDWADLQAARLLPAGASQPWVLIQTREEFERLASGTLPPAQHVIGIFQSGSTTQQARSRAVMGLDPTQPSGIARVPNVPDLATMTRGALNFLSQGQGGFFLMVEGGATDWAAHTSNRPPAEIQYGQLIEETVDFNRAVRAVVEWVESNSSWEDTLLIVTTDHGNGLFLGPEADQIPFQPVENRGRGQIPGMSPRPTGQHTNELVLLWAKGFGSERLLSHVRGRDLGFARHVGHNDGAYIDNTDLFHVMRWVIEHP